MKGTVKNVNDEKGFGFIVGEDGNEYFFHKSAVSRSFSFDRIVKKMAVEFEPEEGARGLRAEDVTPA
jgi:CspA family cold shock protein